MKKIILLLAIFMHTTANAQQAQQIPGYAKDTKPMQWYKTQRDLWQQEIKKNETNENAWMNYYVANRIIIMHDELEKNNDETKSDKLKLIVDNMGKAIPNSYSYNYCKWQIGGNDIKYYNYLQKAIAIDSTRLEHIECMINIGELNRDQKQRNEYSKRNFDAGKMSSGMMYYNYNQLIGLDENAILFTAGDNDTYPSWALQGLGIRTDVKVLNLYLLHIKEYREKIFKELGIQNVEIKDETNTKDFDKIIIEHCTKNKNNYPVYIALTTAGCQNYIASIENQMYLTGLVYKFDTASYDNIAIMKKNFEKIYALDYLDKSFYKEISNNGVKAINQNYLTPMVKLFEHYKKSGDIQHQNWIKEKLLAIAKDSEIEKQIIKIVE
jgi:hypothetical protein